MSSSRRAVAIRPATDADVPAMATVLERAFADDAVWCHYLPDARRRERWASTYWTIVARLAVRRRGAYVTDGVDGALLLVAPGQPAVPTRILLRYLPLAVRVLGRYTLRFLRCTREYERQHPDEPHLYAEFVASAPSAPSSVAFGLINHACQEADRLGVDLYCDVVDPRNARLFGRWGFAVVGEFRLPGRGPSVRRMVRRHTAAIGSTGASTPVS